MASPADTALLLDVMLGRLATYLRMCGYDAAYALDRGVEADSTVLRLAAEEGRTLVTRDAALARRAEDAVLLQTRDIGDQLQEFVDAGFELSLDTPVRCATCNGPLESVPADEPTPEYAPSAAETDVWRCLDCGQHYWRGSHWDDVSRRLTGLDR